MNVTLEQMGIFIGLFMLIIGLVSYFIARKKSDTPIKAALMGGVFSIVPILGIIYVIYLANQKSVTVN